MGWRKEPQAHGLQETQCITALHVVHDIPLPRNFLETGCANSPQIVLRSPSMRDSNLHIFQATEYLTLCSGGCNK